MTGAAEDEVPVVVVVDDDRNVCASLRRVFKQAQLSVETYESAVLFLKRCDLTRRMVLILDVMMPAMSGLDLQRTLKSLGVAIPIVFLTGSSQIPIAVQAMREGAFDFLEKPFDPEQLLSRVRAALESVTAGKATPESAGRAARRLAFLTQREREVMALVATGKTSKEIARELGTSYRTVELQRARVMDKIGARSLADLVRIWLEVASADSAL